ncbi:MAG TPA: hypothetical protein VM325_04455 [Alphaproteobacteria bacterium]|nr:hypothetical protein [Alphaproteobacteria bacterium]
MGAERDTGPRAEQSFFEDPAIDRILGLTMALASEVYVLRDRLRALEARLAEAGVVAPEALDAEPGPEEIARNGADRDAFVAHLMGNLLGEQVSKGAR